MRTLFPPSTAFSLLLTVTCLCSTIPRATMNDVNDFSALAWRHIHLSACFFFRIRVVQHNSESGGGGGGNSYISVASGQPQWKNHRIPYGLWHTLFVRWHIQRHWLSVHIDRVFYSANRAFAVLKLKKKCFGFVWLIWIMLLLFCNLFFSVIMCYCSLVAVCTPFITCFFSKKIFFFLVAREMFFNN